MSQVSVGQILKVIDQLAPFRLAESWDNVGLLVGDLLSPVRRLAVALEVTPCLLADLRDQKVDLLITHHPPIFQPLRHVTTRTPESAAIHEMVRMGMALIAAHTNLDASPWGTNGALAELFGLQAVAPLYPFPPRQAPLKLVIYTPEGAEQAIIEAIARGGGGVIGRYDHCSFRSQGVGTYRPLAGATPWAGTVGQLEQAPEWRIEAEVPAAALSAVLDEARQAHPYEEMAYDVYPRVQPDPLYSMGLTGVLPREMSLASLACQVKDLLPGKESVAFIGDGEQPIVRVAVFSGSGKSAIRDWSGQADALITGEVDHHLAREAQARGMAVIAAGHYATEQPVAPFFAKRLQEEPLIRDNGIETLALQIPTSPFQAV